MTATPKTRVAVFNRNFTWFDGTGPIGGVRAVRAGERVPVRPDEVLFGLIEGKRVPATWEENLGNSIPCPRCGAPLDVAAIRSTPPVRTNLYRAASDLRFMSGGQFFSLRAGELVTLAENVVRDVLPGLLPGALEPTNFNLHRVTCEACGFVEVPIESNKDQ